MAQNILQDKLSFGGGYLTVEPLIPLIPFGPYSRKIIKHNNKKYQLKQYIKPNNILYIIMTKSI